MTTLYLWSPVSVFKTKSWKIVYWKNELVSETLLEIDAMLNSLGKANV